jgi:DNA mismatch repair protein MutL
MIQVLDKSISDKIAAGEVVERPLSIVKELLENSIDAGADSIVVEIRQGGKRYIRISDNGSGIDPYEIELAFARHATSKISKEEDLYAIHTLGFRGEALSSIAAVSKIEVLTRTLDSATGAKVQLEGGVVTEIQPAGCPLGTTMVVTDLFYNTPARLKFMKGDSSESTPIIEFVSQMALAYSHIKFRLINNDQMVFSSNGVGDAVQTIATLYGQETAENLKYFSHLEGSASVEGYVSNLNISRPNRRYQVFFVNGRAIDSRLLQESVSKAYEERLPIGRHPAAFLFLKVPPEELDVNIHPNKLQVKFREEEDISKMLIEGIRKALKTLETVPTVETQKSFVTQPAAITYCFHGERKADEIPASLDEQTTLKQFLAKTRREEAGEKESLVAEKTETMKRDLPISISDISIIDMVFATFILGKDEENLYLVDQHAAHERVFYEALTANYGKKEMMTQSLITPLVLDKPRIIAHLTLQIKEELHRLGFDAEEFGNSSFIIKAIPAFISLDQGETFVREYLDTVTPNSNYEDENTRRMLMTRACKSAVKAQDKLSLEEARALLKDLAQCENPYNCPHGRPVFIKLSLYEIKRMFKRV